MNVSIFFQEVKWQKKIKVKPQKINVTALYNGVKYCLYQFNNRRARVTKTVTKWKACAKYAVKLLIYL